MTQSAIEKKASAEFDIVKLDEQRHRITGFAMISCNRNGEPVYDLQGDHISPDELVKAASDFAALVGESTVDDMHDRTDTGRVVESMVLTSELQKAIGLPQESDLLKIEEAIAPLVDSEPVQAIREAIQKMRDSRPPVGWLVTVEVPPSQFALVKSGKRPMFSIEARAMREAA